MSVASASTGVVASEGSSLNDVFQNIDMGTNDTPQNTQRPVEEPEKPAETPAESETPVTAPEGEKPAETPAAPAAAAPATPPPSWVGELIQGLQKAQSEQNAPVNTFFQALAHQQKVNEANAARQEQFNQLQARQKQLQQMRELQRPRMPSLDQLTPEAAVKYAGELAAFEAKNAREDAAMEMQQHLAAVEAKIEAQNKAQQERELQAESARVSTFIDQSIERFKASPDTKFMENPLAQQLFMSRWWAANDLAGRMVSPSDVMRDFKSELAAINGNAQVVQKRSEADAIAAARKNEQGARGAPGTANGGGANKPANTNASDFEKPWWETGALRTGK